MAAISFHCPVCENGFSVPQERISPAGARGSCTSCHAALVIFPDGRIQVAPAAAPAAPPPAPPPPPDDPIWHVRTTDSRGGSETRGPLRIAEVRQLILDHQMMDTDRVRVLDGDWTPPRAFPALVGFFDEQLEAYRQLHGDEDHCVNHRGTPAERQCMRCEDYLCMECLANRPLLQGGEARYLCLKCDFETTPVRGRAGISGIVKGLLKRKP